MQAFQPVNVDFSPVLLSTHLILRAVLLWHRWSRCLDLGCGTGLSGQAASTICGRLVGVDLSPAMVCRAREKRIYRRLLVGDVTDTILHLCRANVSGREWDVPETRGEEGGALELEHGTSQSSLMRGVGDLASAAPVVSVASEGDLILSCDVFVYIGDLRACFDAVSVLASTGGREGTMFAFSAEASSLVPDVEVMEEPPGDATETTSPCETGKLSGYELQGTGR